MCHFNLCVQCVSIKLVIIIIITLNTFLFYNVIKILLIYFKYWAAVFQRAPAFIPPVHNIGSIDHPDLHSLGDRKHYSIPNINGNTISQFMDVFHNLLNIMPSRFINVVMYFSQFILFTFMVKYHLFVYGCSVWDLRTCILYLLV